MNSRRLPGKVLMDIDGNAMLHHVLTRVQRANSIDVVVVATSTHLEDDAVANFCRTERVPFFRGSLDDVLDRFYQAAQYYEADVIVRLTADCPLLDPLIINKVLDTFHAGRFDYVSNALECTYPDGLDTEVFSRNALESAWKNARLKSEREHVTSYLYNHPELFRIGIVKQEENLSHLRWTVDERQDLIFVRTIFNRMQRSSFGMEDVLRLLRNHPELSQLNEDIKRNEGYLKSLMEDQPINHSEEKL
jgi:spore coat polysaccharide biosynthesis protein SpsF